VGAIHEIGKQFREMFVDATLDEDGDKTQTDLREVANNLLPVCCR
jgi:hypothetical protein